MEKDIIKLPIRIFKRAEELHLYLDLQDLAEMEYACDTYRETQERFESTLDGIVRTTIPFFLSFDFADRLFVHCNCDVHELTVGECEGTERYIRKSHNLQKMLFAGEFSWFDPYIGEREVELPVVDKATELGWLERRSKEKNG